MRAGKRGRPQENEETGAIQGSMKERNGGERNENGVALNAEIWQERKGRIEAADPGSYQAEWWMQVTFFLKGLAVCFACNSPPPTMRAHTRSHSPLWWSQAHTRAQHTNINHCCSLEGDPVVYFPRGSSSSTVSAQHPHWVNVVSHPETQKPTVWGFVWMAVCLYITVLCKSTVNWKCSHYSEKFITRYYDLLR